MKLKYSFLVFFVTCVLLFNTCDLSDDNNNGNETKTGVEPLIKTFWGQGSPYNRLVRQPQNMI
jgi:hypothetical protein